MQYERTDNRPDIIILFITVALVMIGLIMVYSAKLYADQSYLPKQVLRIAIGVVALAVGYLLPLRFWRHLPATVGLLVLITIALLLTLRFGARINNARRQLFGIQFSELAKPAIVLFLACYYGALDGPADSQMKFGRFVLTPVAVCAPALAAVIWEPAVSMALVIALLIAVILYLAEVKLRQILLVGMTAGVLAVAGIGAKSLFDGGRMSHNPRPATESGIRDQPKTSNVRYQMSNAPIPDTRTPAAPVTRERSSGRFRHIVERCRTYLTWASHILDVPSELARVTPLAARRPSAVTNQAPTPTPQSVSPGGQQGIDWQQDQSRIAIGSGNLIGLGLGNGKQKFAFLPMVATDFIFSLIGEEWGFAGSLVIFSLFLLFLLRGMFLIRRAEDTFTRLLISGVVVMIAGTAVIHLFVALRLIPPTGQTLPFVSYGASALAANMFGVGLLLQASRHILRRPIEDDLVSRGWNWWARVSGSRAR